MREFSFAGPGIEKQIHVRVRLPQYQATRLLQASGYVNEIFRSKNPQRRKAKYLTPGLSSLGSQAEFLSKIALTKNVGQLRCQNEVFQARGRRFESRPDRFIFFLLKRLKYKLYQ